MAEAGSKSQVPAQVTKLNTIRQVVAKYDKQIKMALPKHLDMDRFARIFFTTISRTPRLVDCDPMSLLGAAIQCSQLGLEPDNILGRVYLVPFYNSKKRGYEVQVIPGYKGYIELARRSGQVIDIKAHIVYSNEKFEIIYGTDEKVIHKPLPPSERGEKIGVYAMAIFKNAYVRTDWLWPEDVYKARELSQSAWSWDYDKKDWKRDADGNRILNPESIWVKFEDDQWRKTAIRFQSKFLPLSPEFQKLHALEDLAEAGKSQKETFFDDMELADFSAEGAAEATQDKTDELKRRLESAKGNTQVVPDTTK